MNKITNFITLAIMLFFFMGKSNGQDIYKNRAAKNLHYLVKDSILLQQVKIDGEGVSMYATATDKQADRPECRILWGEAERFLEEVSHRHLPSSVNHYLSKGASPYKAREITFVPPPSLPPKPQSIKDLRIAIDPGHFAHDKETARLEWRFMHIRKEEIGTRRDADFFEADLTWRTAVILAKRLEAQGATVFIPREKNRSALGMTFPQWRKKAFEETLRQDLAAGKLDQKAVDWYLKEATESQIFRYMTRKDLEERARKINEFSPDITIDIHYNTSNPKLDEEGYYPSTSVDYSMMFTGGGFMKGELKSPEARFHFLRLLLSKDLEESIELSSAIVEAHQDIVKIEPIKQSKEVDYLNNNSVYADTPGVYCRNLALTRTVEGAICFGESLLQDNVMEAALLSRRDYKEYGIRIPGRLKLVIDAYEAGIKAYLEGTQ